MTIDRRTFIVGTGLCAATPALARFFPASSIGVAPPDASLSLRAPPPSGAIAADSTVFAIRGWTDQVNSWVDTSTTVAPGSGTREPTNEPVWLCLNRSCRAAWR